MNILFGIMPFYGPQLGNKIAARHAKDFIDDPWSMMGFRETIEETPTPSVAPVEEDRMAFPKAEKAA